MIDSFNSIFTHLSEVEKNLLLELSKRLSNNSIIVEIGSYLGASTCFLAYGARETSSVVYAVDSWTNMAMTEGEKDTYEEFKYNVKSLGTVIKPLRGLSIEIAKEFDEKIDFLFIDGDHSYEMVKEDLKSWLPKLKDGAIIAFHDYSWSEGVQKAVDEYVLPIQTEPGRKVDSIYWTRVEPSREENNSISVTVAIPTYKRTDYVLEALKSVINQNTTITYEILILDNDCDSNLKTQVDIIASEVNILVRYIPVNKIGLHNGRNTAILSSKGKLIVFIDDDVIAPDYWLNSLILPFENDDVVFVGGMIKPKWEGSLPEWVSNVDKSFFSILNLGEKPKVMVWPETPYGCNMAVRRDWALKLDGFSPDGMGASLIEWKRGDGETGFAKKIYDHKGVIFYSPSAVLYHRIPPSRLTLSFIYRRTIKGVIGSCYSEIRSRRYSRLHLLTKSFVCVLKSINMAMRYIYRILVKKNKINDEIIIISYFIRSLYYARFLLDSDLKAWVLKKNYML